jgi:hypothetical protein
MQVVTLNAAELERADAYGRETTARARGVDGSDTREGRDTSADAERPTLGAQGELAAAKVLGIWAPLRVNAYRRPDLPPDWSVKTQLASSLDTRRGYMRLREAALGHGWRHIFVVRAERMAGEFLFEVRGWVADATALARAVVLYAYSSNRHLHVRNLEPIEPLCQALEEESGGIYAGLEERAERWGFDQHGLLQELEEIPEWGPTGELIGDGLECFGCHRSERQIRREGCAAPSEAGCIWALSRPGRARGGAQ